MTKGTLQRENKEVDYCVIHSSNFHSKVIEISFSAHPDFSLFQMSNNPEYRQAISQLLSLVYRHGNNEFHGYTREIQ